MNISMNIYCQTEERHFEHLINWTNKPIS